MRFETYKNKMKLKLQNFRNIIKKMSHFQYKLHKNVYGTGLYNTDIKF